MIFPTNHEKSCFIRICCAFILVLKIRCLAYSRLLIRLCLLVLNKRLNSVDKIISDVKLDMNNVRWNDRIKNDLAHCGSFYFVCIKQGKVW